MFLLMPAAAIFICGMLLMGAAARLMPERGYSRPGQKMFWLVTILAGSIIGLAWASTGARASTLSQPPVAQLLLTMSAFLALSVGAIVFPTESARGSEKDQERLKQMLGSSRIMRLLGPGPLRGTLFVLAGSALVLFLIVLFLGLSSDPDTEAHPGARTLAALYFSLLGILAMLAALGLALSTTRLNTKRRRLILMVVLGITVAVIPAAVAFLGLGLPTFMTELSPVIFTAVALKEIFMLGGLIFQADAISWTPIVLTYWIPAVVLGGVSALQLWKRAKAVAAPKGRKK
jgi:hypothetical protein